MNIVNYITSDNGGSPYRVTVLPGNFTVYANHGFVRPRPKGKNKVVYKQTDYVSFWVERGVDPGYPGTPRTREFFEGAAVMASITEYEHVYIGDCVLEFQTTGKIESFYNGVGNNGVLYSYATTTDGKAYMFNERIVMHSFDKYKDVRSKDYQPSDRYENYTPYDLYYEQEDNEHKSGKKGDLVFTPLECKVISDARDD